MANTLFTDTKWKVTDDGVTTPNEIIYWENLGTRKNGTIILILKMVYYDKILIFFPEDIPDLYHLLAHIQAVYNSPISIQDAQYMDGYSWHPRDKAFSKRVAAGEELKLIDIALANKFFDGLIPQKDEGIYYVDMG